MTSTLFNKAIPPEDIPVLLTIFNRPEKTRRVMQNLRQITPKRLFVAADGPRSSDPQDFDKCMLARQEATTVDWPCEIKTRFHEQNLGVDPAVSSAVHWFFQNVEYGIILEDDCITHPDFFTICGQLLIRYFDDQRIMQISALSPYPPRQYPYHYHFSRIFRPGGGWATWRRAWKHFTSDMHRYSHSEALAILTAYRQDRSTCYQKYKSLLSFKSGVVNLWAAWDVQWNMACYAQSGLAIVPENNLMTNIGFDEESTHTRQKNPIFENLAVSPLEFPLTHPPFVYADIQPERSLERKIYRSLSPKSRFIFLLRKVLGAIYYLKEVMPYG